MYINIFLYFRNNCYYILYNLLHLNALYDVCSKIYVDTIIQKSRNSNENQALIDMVDRNSEDIDTLIIADRGYESYNALAHIQEKGSLCYEF